MINHKVSSLYENANEDDPQFIEGAFYKLDDGLSPKANNVCVYTRAGLTYLDGGNIPKTNLRRVGFRRLKPGDILKIEIAPW